MKITLWTLTVILLTSCIHRTENIHFSKKQIESLKLDSTEILNSNSDNITTIDLNPFLKKQSFGFGEMVEEINLVPLETNKNSYVNDIYNVIATDSNIYVHDTYKGGGVIIFDNEGKFIKRLSNGRGPGEIMRLYDIDFDKHKNELVIYQHSFLLFFSPTGEYLRQEQLPIGFYNFTTTPDGYIFKTLYRQNNHLGSLNNHTLFITDKKYQVKSSALPLPDMVGYSGYNYLYKNNNSIYITNKFIDTIYQYVNETNQLNAEYVLDYDNKKLPSYVSTSTFEEFDNKARQNDYYFFIGGYLDTGSHHLFFLENSYIRTLTVIYRDKRSGNMFGGTSANYNLKEIPPIAFPRWAYGNYLISAYLPSENDLFATHSNIISESDKQKVVNLTENDNPVLVFFKLKVF